LEIRPPDETRKATLRRTGIILHSSDSGKSWFPIYRSQSNETFIFLIKVNDNYFYAISDTGTFLRFALAGK